MKIRLLVAAVLAAAATPALAADLSYTHFDAKYSSLDSGQSGDGFGLRGSYQFHDNLYLLAQYSQGSFDVLNFDSSELRLGVGYRLPMSATVDFVAELNLERADIEFDNPFGPGRLEGSDNGFGVSGGVRGMLSEQFELNGKLRYIDYGSGTNDFVVGIGAVYALTGRVGLIGEYESGDLDALSIGLRVNF